MDEVVQFTDEQLGIKPKPESNQQAFDNAWHYFVTEGHGLARDSHNATCFYRHPTVPTACAIGCQLPSCLLPSYNPSIESLLDQSPRVADYFSAVNSDLLVELQSAHDAADSLMDFRLRMRQIAENFGLTVPGETAA